MITIQQLHIYGFGKHINKKIQLADGMNIVYGENEAGKTTIQQFIVQIFFGFPAKNSLFAKYEPKTASRFGGAIVVKHPKYGVCTIERMKGKAAGDVTVTLQDGTVGRDELLAKVLYGYSRQAFESIFAFSLHELQGIERMSEEELSRVLLASGTTGVDKLTKLQQQLDKNIGGFYKKGGKNPVINQKLEQLQQTEKKIHAEQFKIAAYDTDIADLQQVEKVLIDKQQQSKIVQSTWQSKSILLQSLPLLQEQHILTTELARQTVTQFPTDGIRRYEQVKDRLLHAETKVNQLQQQLAELHERAAHQIDEQLSIRLQHFAQQESEWYQLQANMKTLHEEIELLQVQQHNHFLLLGIHEANEQANMARQNVSLQEEEKFQQLLANLEQLEQRQQMQSLAIETIRDELDDIEQQVRDYMQQQPTTEERAQVAQWPEKKQRLDKLRVIEQSAKQGGTLLRVALSIIGLAALSLVFGLWQKNWSVLFISVAFLVIGIQLYKQQVKVQRKESENVRQTLHELRVLEQQIPHMEQLKEQVYRYDERLQLLQQQRQSKLNHYKRVELDVITIETNIASNWADIHSFLTRFSIHGVTQRKLLPELFGRVRDIQQAAMMIEHKQFTLSSYEQQYHSFIEMASELIAKPCTKDSLFIYVREALRLFEEQQHERLHVKERMIEIENQLTLHVVEQNALREEIQQLFTQALATTEQAFYEQDMQFQRYQQSTARLHDIEQQLQNMTLERLEVLPTSHDLTYELNELQQQQQQLQIDIEQLLQRRATLQHTTNVLLTDEQYGMLLLSFEQQKSELEELVKQWSIQKAIVSAIQQTMTVLREEKLPKVLDGVNDYFYTLTNGAYTLLAMNEAGHFEALNDDGVRYHLAELSQATKEQAYVALRLALAKSLESTAPFPLVMDDPFVHFDRNRFMNMVQLMRDVATERQILYFTCHHSVHEMMQDVHHIDLSNDERGVPF